MMIDLRLGDCLSLMPSIPTHGVDAIIADLPYGTTACTWDLVIPFEPLWAEYKRIIKPRGAIVLFGSQPFTSLLVTSNPRWFRYEWIWNKVACTNFLDVNRRPMGTHESILVFAEGQTMYNPQITGLSTKRFGAKSKKRTAIYHGNYAPDQNQDGIGYPKTIIEYMRPNNLTGGGLHPTQKPVALLKYLIRTYTNEGETVLDNVMGSGTTMVACVNTGRNGIGIELDPTYFAIAQRRIADAQAQPRLELAVAAEQPEQLAMATGSA